MRNLILISILTFLIPNAFATNSLSYKSMSITDDEIAQAIRNPSPISVTDLIQDIQKKKNYQYLNYLDISENNITSNGANTIFRFILNDLPNLKGLNLSNNHIRDLRGNEGYQEFEDNLVNLINREPFEILDLRINAISNMNWISQLTPKVGNNHQKIRWNN